MNNNKNFYSISIEDTLREINSDRNGLSNAEAEKRIDKFGYNRLPKGKRQNPVLRFLSHFHDVLIYVLIASALVTAFLEHWIDTGIIAGVVFINAFVGFIQEGKAEKAIDAVRNMLSQESRVLRDGKKITLAAEDLVPGDIVFLSSGDRVPADIRLIHVHELQINEASLTGESETVSKNTEPVTEDAPLGDRKCMAYSGTIVTSGTTTAVVTATGEDTEIGRINKMLSDVETLTTPLLKQVNRFGLGLSMIILTMTGLIFAIGLYMAAMPLEDLFLSAVAIAVAAIPEGLPAVISIILAIGVRRMADRNAIIRRLPGVETLGSVSVICTDKTGTLTKSEMTVTKVVLSNMDVDVKGTGYSPEGKLSVKGESVKPESDSNLHWMIISGTLCNEARLYSENDTWFIDGNPTEGSLLTLAAKAGYDPEEIDRQWKRVDEIPFESDHKFMATINRNNSKKMIFFKGATEVVLPKCNTQMAENGDVEDLDRAWWNNRADELASQGFRILSIAMTESKEDSDSISFRHIESGLTHIGLAAIMDPPRPEAVEAVKKCSQAGIRVKMITGDHARTASAIAREMNISDGSRVMTGTEIEKTSDEKLESMVEEIDVYARVSPEHKLRLVTALQNRGHITAMTGDGVNDAPALKKSNIGIAMGKKGTEAAKEAAEMVLADDNFASIVHAVEEGRTVYDNLKKTLLFMLPTNGGEALVIMVAIALGFVIPMTPAQVLWVNMVTAVTLALSLAFEPTEEDIMRRSPRPTGESLVSLKMLLRITYVSALLMAGSFGLFALYRAGGAQVNFARTIAVNAIIMGEIFYLFNSRYITISSLSIKGLIATPQVWIATITVLLLQIPFTYLPLMQDLFGTASIGFMEWISILAAGGGIFLIVETEKFIVRKKQTRKIQ